METTADLTVSAVRDTRRRGRSRRSLPIALFGLLLLAGCAGDSPSALNPAGTGSARVAGLWWLLFWISMAVFVEVMALLIWALVFRRGTARVRHGQPLRFVTIAGAGLPLVILVAVYGVGLRDLAALGDGPGPEAPTVEVTGHKWWWEVRYPGASGATANEIHIPVGEQVRVRLRTADVLHSFWVPQLMPKTDLIAGETRETWLRAERAGSYRGQCAEYCGTQHAHMAFLVVAQPRADYDAWLARLDAPAREPGTDAERRGRQAFVQGTCSACHAVRGTGAEGRVGPDLSNVGSRWSIGAGAVPNDAGHLGGWIANSQTAKPGNAMPPQPIDAARLPDLIAYLRSLE
ncbi:Cytochrome c oxidase subunit 2 precursor [Micromonospora sp. MW-13]|uniref:cytochrome c oxidase subunit II n=1 Tax=Micromonospora sp. MW-13 TaxID=2094022 RepID=UPI000E451C54|nr:cytochrome c oxidase subunit II [Micromonospora sp. MW-13]RGC66747.1 Cytochrome c oxidase subunit 2 precursor [Micromonospora sp. MW-13]